MPHAGVTDVHALVHSGRIRRPVLRRIPRCVRLHVTFVRGAAVDMLSVARGATAVFIAKDCCILLKLKKKLIVHTSIEVEQGKVQGVCQRMLKMCDVCLVPPEPLVETHDSFDSSGHHGYVKSQICY